ncbi:hypothetical protein [Novosphingopyxis sp.]|uniref:hypothetical protein n=1 Tax=Novosphingopyxis sp. TaxID=2709690 RepID=UPI003B5BD5FE
MIEAVNPNWRDLALEFGFDRLPSLAVHVGNVRRWIPAFAGTTNVVDKRVHLFSSFPRKRESIADLYP